MGWWQPGGRRPKRFWDQIIRRDTCLIGDRDHEGLGTHGPDPDSTRIMKLPVVCDADNDPNAKIIMILMEIKLKKTILYT